MSRQISIHNRRAMSMLLMAALLASFILTACGGGGSEETSADSAEGSRRGAAPTMPSANFAAVEGDVDLTKVAEKADEGTPEPEGEVDLSLGESAYGRLCAECHGDAGEGVPDKGEAIVGLMADHDEFVDLLRTGGGYGNDHIFGPTKISEDGMESLFAYAQTLEGK